MKGVKSRKRVALCEREYQLDRHGSRSDIENAAGRVADHFFQAAEREEMQMGCVEDSSFRGIEISKQEFEANGPVGNIRDRNDELPGIHQGGNSPAQHR